MLILDVLEEMLNDRRGNEEAGIFQTRQTQEGHPHNAVVLDHRPAAVPGINRRIRLHPQQPPVAVGQKPGGVIDPRGPVPRLQLALGPHPSLGPAAPAVVSAKALAALLPPRDNVPNSAPGSARSRFQHQDSVQLEGGT